MGFEVAEVSDDQIQLERDGIWRPVMSTMDDGMEVVEFKVRYWETAGGQAEFMKRLHRNKEYAQESHTDAQKFRIVAQKKALIQMCLAGWRTSKLEKTGDEANPYRRESVIRENEVEIGKGNWVPFSQSNAMMLTQHKYRRLYAALESSANDDDSYREYLRNVAGNSSGSSVGSSSTSGSLSPTPDDS